MQPDDPAYPGQAEYTPAFLRVYDPLVLGFFCRFVWRCSKPRLVEHYRRHIGARHLDIGPGTGYFLQQVDPPEELTVLDPNPNVLTYVRRRIPNAEAVEADACHPLPVVGPFDSVAINGVLHCLPSAGGCKEAALGHAAEVLVPSGVLFGATIVTEGHTAISRQFLHMNNRRGVFDNLTDSPTNLEQWLSASFDDVEIKMVGSMAVFAARQPR